MELVKLHVGQLGSRRSGKGDAVSRSDGRVGGVAVDLARATGGNQHRSRGNAIWRLVRSQGSGRSQVSADHAAGIKNQVRDHGPFGKANALACAGVGHKRPADLGSGGVAVLAWAGVLIVGISALNTALAVAARRDSR